MQTTPVSNEGIRPAPTPVKKISKGRVLLLKCLLAGLCLMLAVVDIRLAGSHLARSFPLFRKPHQAFPVFTFGVSFWAFLLGFPLSLIRFRKLGFRHRYLLSALTLLVLLLLSYLGGFLYYLARS